MRIVFAPDGRAEALAQGFGTAQCIPAAQADRAVLEPETALLLVTTDYYTHAHWRMKRWAAQRAAALEGKLCACLALSGEGGGGEPALRSLVSQLLAAGSVVCLCAVACGDGMIRPGDCAEPCTAGMTPPEYYTKLLQMAAKFG